ncbi:MAG: SIMPL domain-containing protein [Candidatus Paceibacterota bacterium]|jgi:hypothetical protein
MQENNLKKFFWFLLDIVLAAIFIAVMFSVIPAVNKAGNSQMPVRTLVVNAEGKTTVKPDLAQFSFSVVTDGTDLALIAKNNNDLVNKAIDFVKKSGVDEKDIKTTQYNLNPRYEYNESQKKTFISGYELTQTVFVKIRDLEKNIDKVSKILGLLPEMGVNQISSVSFTNEDQELFLAQARKDAFDKAFTKAKSMAKANGVSLGEVINVNEYQNGPIYYDSVSSMKGMGIGGGSIAPMPAIQPGTEELKVNVTVTYELR